MRSRSGHNQRSSSKAISYAYTNWDLLPTSHPPYVKVPSIHNRGYCKYYRHSNCWFRSWNRGNLTFHNPVRNAVVCCSALDPSVLLLFNSALLLLLYAKDVFMFRIIVFLKTSISIVLSHNFSGGVRESDLHNCSINSESKTLVKQINLPKPYIDKRL